MIIYIYGKWWRFPCSKPWSTSGNGSECQHKVLGIYTIISELMESQLGTYGNEWEFMIIQGNHQWETLRSWAYSDIFMAPYTQCSYGIHLDPQSQYMGIDMRNPSTLEMMDKFRHGNGNCWRVVGKWWKMKLSSGMVHYCGSSIIICLIYINSKWLFGRGGSFKHAWRWSRKGASWPWWARVTDTWYNIRVVFQPIVGDILIDDQPY